MVDEPHLAVQPYAGRRIPDIRNCAREIISFINQQPYVSTSSRLNSHTTLHPPSVFPTVFLTPSSVLPPLFYVERLHPPNRVERNGYGILTIRYRLKNSTESRGGIALGYERDRYPLIIQKAREKDKEKDYYCPIVAGKSAISPLYENEYSTFIRVAVERKLAKTSTILTRCVPRFPSSILKRERRRFYISYITRNTLSIKVTNSKPIGHLSQETNP